MPTKKQSSSNQSNESQVQPRQMTFNADLWQFLRAWEGENKKKFIEGKIYFGLAPENTPVPYCVMHVMDSGDDPNAQTLCQNEEGYNAVGESRIQFNLYGFNDMQIDELLQELNYLIKSLKNLTVYRIMSCIRERTKTASSFSAEIGQGLTEFQFQHERL